MKTSRAGVRLAVVLSCWCATVAMAGEPGTLTLAMQAYRPSPELEQRYRPLADYLTRHLDNTRVVLRVLDQAGLDAALARNQLDLVLTDPAHYLILRSRNSLSGALATSISSHAGQHTDSLGGVIFTRADSPIVRTLADLRNIRIAVPATGDLGGFLTQAYELLQADIRLPDDARLDVAGNHDEVISRVLSGRADAGFVRSGVIEQLSEGGQLDLASIRIINRQNLPGFPFIVSTRLYPEWPLVALPHLPDNTVRKVAAALLALDASDPAARAAGIAGFAPPSDILPVERLARQLRQAPYDDLPAVSLADIWQAYRTTIVVALLASLTIVLLAFRLWVSNQRLRREQTKVTHAKQTLRQILDNAPIGIWRQNARGELDFCNRALFDALGMRDPAQEGNSPDPSPEWPASVAHLFAAWKAPQERHCTEVSQVKLPTASGVRELEIFRTCLHAKDGRLDGWIGICSDVTERKQTLAALQHERSVLRTLFQTLPDLVWLKDMNGVYLACNYRFESYFGASEADIVGRRDHDFVAADIAESYLEHDRRAMTRGSASVNEERLVFASDGHEELVETTKTPMIDAHGALIGVLGIAHDITLRKRTEAQLRKLSQAVEQSPASITITDLAGAIEYVNEAFLNNTGYTREEVLGNNPRLLRSGHTPASTYASMWSALTGGRSWKGEFHNRRKDGSEYVEFAVITPLRDIDGQVTHYVSVQDDITEKKRLGAELDRYRHQLEERVEQRTRELELARSQAEAASVAKSEFLANMSHEIRTPLNAITGMAELIRRSGLTQEQGARLAKLEGAAQHLLGIINAILDLSKIEAGQFELEETELDLATLVESVRTMLSDRAEAKRLSLRTHVQSPHCMLLGDPTRLRQAVLNYAANAIKFTDKGSVSIRVSVDAESEHSVQIRIEVSDTGIGIAPAELQRLFSAFQQADNSTTRRYGGTGLGLAITKKLAKLMGGDAGATSTPGQGSTFWLTARLRKRSPAGGTPCRVRMTSGEAELAETCGGRRILLAEDEPLNRELTKILLEQTGLILDMAEDGEQVVRMFEAGHYDLVLMDMQMPRLSGIEATKAIRRLVRGRDVPIIAMTANAFTEDRRQCLAAGMNDFLSKPVSPEDLFAALLRWLDAKPVEA